MKVDIKGRKRDHVESARRRDVEYLQSPGFEDVRFVHQPLPEMALDDVDTECRMFGKMMSAPIIILGMTGGYPEAAKINAKLAAAAEKEGFAFGLGSQRAMMEKPSLASTYKMRKLAPTIPLIGNIGGCQLKKYGVKKVREALDDVGADALAIHLNPLQEVCQPEGDHDFSGILPQISIFCRDLGLPVIVKETGAGMSMEACSALRRAGVSMVDVSGAGGTSWSKVEYMRSGKAPVFENWGNPTCASIAACAEILETIGSGGVRNGLDAAKAIALGSSYAGAALPFLRASDPAKEAAAWKRDLKIAMLLSGSRSLWKLRHARLVISGKAAEEMTRIGVDVNRYARR
ncbi:MAG: type 2 isopentenyl-diphosphate Delta-isomerase [Candidatus Micrarchaeia archaeon]|jgi:isopentenyl-diphosphate delta-isomerase